MYLITITEDVEINHIAVTHDVEQAILKLKHHYQFDDEEESSLRESHSLMMHTDELITIKFVSLFLPSEEQNDNDNNNNDNDEDDNEFNGSEAESYLRTNYPDRNGYKNKKAFSEANLEDMAQGLMDWLDTDNEDEAYAEAEAYIEKMYE